MQAPATPLDQVCDALTDVLGELDRQGHAMAGVHLAMAVDCLRASLDSGLDEQPWAGSVAPQLRLVASS